MSIVSGIIFSMKVYRLIREQFVSCTRDKAYSFSQDPENLEALIPKGLHFHILTPTPIKMNQGRLIDYSIRIAGIQRRWTSLITDFQSPEMFVDEALRSPYRFWHHTHQFIEHDDGTVIRDDIRDSLHFGPLTAIAHFLFFRRQLTGIFQYRASIIKGRFGGENA